MVQFERYDLIAGYTVCNIQESTLQGKQSKFKREIARNSKKHIQADKKRAFAEQRTRTSRVGAGRVCECRTHWKALSRNTLSDIALHQRRQSNPRIKTRIREKTEALTAGDEVDGLPSAGSSFACSRPEIGTSACQEWSMGGGLPLLSCEGTDRAAVWRPRFRVSADEMKVRQ